MPDNLKQKTTSAFGWALGGQLSNQLFGFFITLVLARILTPEEFGLAGLVLVVNLVAQVFLDSGIAAGLIRKTKVNQKELSTFFYLNIALGLLVMTIVVVSSSLIGQAFDNDKLAALLRLSSIQFVINSFSIIPTVIEKRDINFKFLSKLDVAINVISGLITILLAMLGFGVYSLILRGIISGTINTTVLWKNTKWKPDTSFSLNSIKDTAAFSSGVLGLAIINRISANFSTILIGKVFSVSTIGIYNRAENTRGLILKNFGPLFNKVFYPVLSKIQDDNLRLQSYYLKAIQMVSLLVVFFMSILFLFSDSIILMLYGHQWVESAPILKILSLAGLVLPLSNINLNLFMVKGKSRFLMSYELIKHILTAIGMIISINYGMTIFLYSLVGLAYAIFGANVFLTYKKFNFSIKLQLIAFLSKLIPAFILVLFSKLVISYYGGLSWVLVVTALIFSLSYFCLSFIIDKELYIMSKEIALPIYLRLKKITFKIFNKNHN